MSGLTQRQYVVVDSDGDGKISYNEFVSLMMLSAHEDDSG